MTNILLLAQLPETTFQIVTNGDFRDVVAFVEDATVNPPTAIDITGIVFSATVRRADALDDEILFQASTADGSITLDGPAGLMKFAIPKEQLKNLAAGDAQGDVLATADGMTINLCKDKGPLRFTIRRGLT